MTQIQPRPLYMKDVRLKLGVDNYEKTISGCTFTPTSAATTWTGLTPTATYSDQATPTWVCQLDYVQDWESADSLARYLHDNAGVEVEAAFEPKAGGPSIAARLTLVPGPIGGPGGAYATASVTLGSSYPEVGPVIDTPSEARFGAANYDEATFAK